MPKKLIIIFAIVIPLLIGFNFFLFSRMNKLKKEQAVVPETAKVDGVEALKITLKGMVKIGAKLTPPHNFCPDGFYLTVPADQILISGKNYLQLRVTPGNDNEKEIEAFLQYLNKSVTVSALFLPGISAECDKDTLSCVCDDFVIVEEISGS
jgi:hypothetical protein